ncbi:PdaC/SigV domain-containing protein [Methylocella sp.]|uniref:PdaC/SigV domain-containing protein n=1 Tax=Methylocella sp. TaxID=1978226 RepID=UPI003784AF21
MPTACVLPAFLAALLAGLAAGLAPAPAFALDCGKAKAPLEKAICASPEATAADAAMTQAYDMLARSLAPDHRAALLASQKRFLKRRDDMCGWQKPDPACAAKMTQARADFLAGRPQSGPGPAPPGLAPVFLQHEAKPGETNLDVNVLKFVDPRGRGEKAFNAWSQSMIKDAPPIRDKDAAEGLPADMTLEYYVDVAATYASPKFISAQALIYQFTGGAHGMSGASSIAVDLAEGRKLAFLDMFSHEAKAQLTQDCFAQILKARVEKTGEETADPFFSRDAIRKSVAEIVGDLADWSFFADRGVVTFDAYAVGSYAEGSYACEFPVATLKPLLVLDYLAP